MCVTNQNLAISTITLAEQTIEENKTLPVVVTNKTFTNSFSNKKIYNRITKELSDQCFFNNNYCFIHICDGNDEQKAIRQLQEVFAKSTKETIKKWLLDDSIPYEKDLVNPIMYLILCNKVHIVKQLLILFREKKNSKLNQIFKCYHKTSTVFSAGDRRVNINHKYILISSLKYNDVELVKELIRYFLKDHSISCSAFAEMMRSTIDNSQVDIFTEVLKQFISVNKKLFIEKYSSIEFDYHDRKYSPLEYATIKNNYAIVKLLLENNVPTISHQCNPENTLLYAIKNKNLELIKLLVKHGAELNRLSFDDVKYKEIIHFWRGISKTSYNEFNYYRVYRSYLEQAIEFGDAKTILYFLDNLTVPTFDKGTAAWLDKITVSWLANPDLAHIHFQMTPLHMAIYLNKPEIVALLLVAKFDGIKVSDWKDKAIYLDHDILVDNDNRPAEISYISAAEYAQSLNDGKNRDKIIAMINQPISLEFQAAIQLLRDNSLAELRETFSTIYKNSEIANLVWVDTQEASIN